MERRQFTREFKLEAVRLIRERSVSYAQASKDLGVHPTQLRNWVKQLADDPQHAFPDQGQMKPEHLPSDGYSCVVGVDGEGRRGAWSRRKHSSESRLLRTATCG
jgi:transposase